MKLSHFLIPVVISAGIAGCVQRTPPMNAEASCGHLAALYPIQYRECLQSVAVSNAMRERAWSDAMARNARANQPAFNNTVDPSTYTLDTHPSGIQPASPMPSLQGNYAPPPPVPTVQYIPYPAVAPYMPGIGPDGTAR